MILVRHSEPEIDPSLGSEHWRLSSRGRARCSLLADQLRSLTPDAIYTSPERKALETAEIVADALGLSLAVIADLREHDRGGVPFYTRPAEFEEHVRRLFATPDIQVFGRESGAAALTRFDDAIQRVLLTGDRQPIVVTHGTVLSLYLRQVTGADAATVWQELSMPCFVVVNGAPNEEVRIQHLTS